MIDVDPTSRPKGPTDIGCFVVAHRCAVIATQVESSVIREQHGNPGVITPRG
jgi:hypothetical protein